MLKKTYSQYPLVISYNQQSHAWSKVTHPHSLSTFISFWWKLCWGSKFWCNEQEYPHIQGSIYQYKEERCVSPAMRYFISCSADLRERIYQVNSSEKSSWSQEVYWLIVESMSSDKSSQYSKVCWPIRDPMSSDKSSQLQEVC